MRRICGVTAIVLGLLAATAGAGERSYGGANGRLVFSAVDGYLYAVASAGGSVRRLVAGRSPAWAPNGRRFAFVRGDRIWIASADGKRLALLSTNTRGADVQPSWSPDGTRLAFIHMRGNRSSIQVIDLTRGRRIVLVQPAPSFVYTPTWSPDGTRIVFARLESDDTTQLYSVRADGSRLRRLTRGSGSHVEPSWSPQGDWIVFVRSNLGPGRLFLMRPDGSGTRPFFSRAFDDVGPAWSPDGRSIAFARKSAVAADRSLYVVDLATKAVRRLTTRTPSIARIDWQPLPRAGRHE